MADDPYAQYLTPPSSGGGSDPYAKYSGPPGGSATAQAVSDNDYSNSPLGARLGGPLSSAGAGAQATFCAPAATDKKPSETAAQSSARRRACPGTSVIRPKPLGYGLGLVNLLGPLTDAAEAGALGLGAGAKLAKVASTASKEGDGWQHQPCRWRRRSGDYGHGGRGAGQGGAGQARLELQAYSSTKRTDRANAKASIDPATATAATEAAKDTAVRQPAGGKNRANSCGQRFRHGDEQSSS